MATRITVTTSSQGLVGRVKAVQAANREAQLRKEQEAATEEEVNKAVTAEQDEDERPVGGLPDTEVARRTSAQRAGSVMGVTYTFEIDSYSSRTARLRVGTADFAQSTEIGGIFDPGLVPINDVTLPASGSSGDAVEAVGGLHYYDPFFVNGYQAWSALAFGGVGSPPLLYQGTQPPPSSSQVDTWTASWDNFSTDQSAAFVLPAGGKNAVFVYVHNKIKVFNTYRRIRRRIQVTENPRIQTNLAERIGSGVWYDMRMTDRTILEYIDTQPFAAYGIYAFLVSSRGVKAINVPSVLSSYIQALCPPVTVNSTYSKLTESGGGQVSAYGPGSSSYFFSIPNVYATMPTIDDAAWRAETVYGSFPTDHDVLAKQFGIGWLQYSNHRGDFFSPAVYNYLKGNLDLSAANATQYAAMRLQLNNLPPKKYLAPCVQNCDTDDTDFYSTTTEPASITTALAEQLFKLDRRYKVKLGEVSSGQLYYCWDWDKKGYCRQQLASLGFTAADLTP